MRHVPLRRSPWPVLGLIVLALLATACSREPDSHWLIGDWHVAYNPRHEPDDILRFAPDHDMSVLLADGRVVDGHYRLKAGTLILDLAVPKRETVVRIRVSPDHRRLVFASGAYYEKKRP